jgi:enamine deaminase RidA (YjgF/YER057c/UK114 family)
MATFSAPVPVNPPSLPKPSGYSHGTLCGNTLHLGGQTALDQDMKIVPGGIVAQFRQAFGNVLATLPEAGGIPEDLVSITIYLTDIPDYRPTARRSARSGASWPARSIPRWRASARPRCGSPRP